MAVERLAQSKPFSVGTRPETARLLNQAGLYGALEVVDSRDALMLARYFQTNARVVDISVASGLSPTQVQLRLRRSLSQIRQALPDEVRDTHVDEALLLKTSHSRRTDSARRHYARPFSIDVRLQDGRVIDVQRQTMEMISERPYIFFTSSEYFLRQFRDPALPVDKKERGLFGIEKRVLELLGQGHNFDQIAYEVGESVGMVKYYAGKRRLQKALGVSSTHEALVVALHSSDLSLGKVSEGLTISDSVVNSLTAREVEVLLADTVQNVGLKRSEISRSLGISDDALELQRETIYRKIGVKNRMQATVFVFAYVQKSRVEKRFSVSKDEGKGSFVEQYLKEDMPVDVQYVVNLLDGVGIDLGDKVLFLTNYLWHTGDGSSSLVAKYLGITDPIVISNSYRQLLSNTKYPKYKLPILNIYQRIFDPILIARDLFYRDKNEDRSMDKFKALVRETRKKVRPSRRQANITRKTGIDIEEKAKISLKL